MALFGRRKPAFQLSGLVCSPDGLYDGSFVVACARWWNHEIETRPEMARAGHRSFSADEVRQLCAVVQPQNREAFEALADAVSLPGRYSGAVLSLAYALAVVVDAGATQAHGEPDTAPAWTQARPFTSSDLVELERHYSEEGMAHEYQLWAPYWMGTATVFAEKIGTKLIASARATFDDQVDRWGAAEGFDLRRSIGAPDYSIIAFNENAGLSNFVELLFEWGGRLRLGERFLADGADLETERFGPIDEGGLIDHFYGEIFERFVALASEADPVTQDIVDAVECCAAWLEEAHGADQLAVATVAKRGYLWRQAHDRVSYDFMEPKLSEAIDASKTVGDNRGPKEAPGVTLYFAATQCMVDGVHTRLGSVGGLLHGAKAYERAFYDTTCDLEEQGILIDEEAKRLAFQFGVCLADVEHVMAAQAPVAE